MAKWRLVKDGKEIGNIYKVAINTHEEYSFRDNLDDIFSKNWSAWEPAIIKDKEQNFGILLKDGSYVKAELIKEPDNIMEWFNEKKYIRFKLIYQSGSYLLMLDDIGLHRVPKDLPFERQKRIILKLIDLYS